MKEVVREFGGLPVSFSREGGRDRKGRWLDVKDLDRARCKWWKMQVLSGESERLTTRLITSEEPGGEELQKRSRCTTV